ncbi:MAG: hypothetical protein LBU31_03175 [Coriobacteriales bacterium]|jgi:hypothetical protein|nr:hypothetical protein [Coriobacteriales bacterium]
MECQTQRAFVSVKRRLRRFALCSLALLLCALPLSLVGCQSTPTHQVDSYNQIKEALADQPDIIYPDLSRYEQTGTLIYVVHHYIGNTRLFDGYSVYLQDSEMKDAASASALSSIEIGCLNEEHLTEFRLPEFSAHLPVMRYRTVEMEYIEENSSVYGNGEDTGYPYPEGSKIGAFSCSFSLKGYRYSLSAGVLLTPDDLKVVDLETELGKARAEFFTVIDSILDQGGVPK